MSTALARRVVVRWPRAMGKTWALSKTLSEILRTSPLHETPMLPQPELPALTIDPRGHGFAHPDLASVRFRTPIAVALAPARPQEEVVDVLVPATCTPDHRGSFDQAVLDRAMQILPDRMNRQVEESIFAALNDGGRVPDALLPSGVDAGVLSAADLGSGVVSPVFTQETMDQLLVSYPSLGQYVSGGSASLVGPGISIGWDSSSYGTVTTLVSASAPPAPPLPIVAPRRPARTVRGSQLAVVPEPEIDAEEWYGERGFV